MPRAWRLRPDQDGAVRPCAFLTAVHDLCAPRCRKHFFRCCILRRRKRFLSHRAAASPSVHRVPRAVRNDLARPRRSATLTNALLLFCLRPHITAVAFAPMVRANFSVSHILPMQALRSYCAAASPSVHRILQSSSRRFSALPRRLPLSLGRFAMTLHGCVAQPR